MNSSEIKPSSESTNKSSNLKQSEKRSDDDLNIAVKNLSDSINIKSKNKDKKESFERSEKKAPLRNTSIEKVEPSPLNSSNTRMMGAEDPKADVPHGGHSMQRNFEREIAAHAANERSGQGTLSSVVSYQRKAKSLREYATSDQAGEFKAIINKQADSIDYMSKILRDSLEKPEKMADWADSILAKLNTTTEEILIPAFIPGHAMFVTIKKNEQNYSLKIFNANYESPLNDDESKVKVSTDYTLNTLTTEDIFDIIKQDGKSSVSVAAFYGSIDQKSPIKKEESTILQSPQKGGNCTEESLNAWLKHDTIRSAELVGIPSGDSIRAYREAKANSIENSLQSYISSVDRLVPPHMYGTVMRAQLRADATRLNSINISKKVSNRDRDRVMGRPAYEFYTDYLSKFIGSPASKSDEGIKEEQHVLTIDEASQKIQFNKNTGGITIEKPDLLIELEIKNINGSGTVLEVTRSKRTENANIQDGSNASFEFLDKTSFYAGSASNLQAAEPFNEFLQTDLKKISNPDSKVYLRLRNSPNQQNEFEGIILNNKSGISNIKKNNGIIVEENLTPSTIEFEKFDFHLGNDSSTRTQDGGEIENLTAQQTEKINKIIKNETGEYLREYFLLDANNSTVRYFNKDENGICEIYKVYEKSTSDGGKKIISKINNEWVVQIFDSPNEVSFSRTISSNKAYYKICDYKKDGEISYTEMKPHSSKKNIQSATDRPPAITDSGNINLEENLIESHTGAKKPSQAFDFLSNGTQTISLKSEDQNIESPGDLFHTIDGSIETTKNKNGDLVTTERYNNNKNITSTSVREYGDEGRLRSITTYDSAGNFYSNGTATYDEKGEVDFIDEVDLEGNTISKTQYDHANNNYVTSVESNIGARFLEKFRIDDGSPISASEYHNGKLTRQVSYLDGGNINETVYPGNKSIIKKYRYEGGNITGSFVPYEKIEKNSSGDPTKVTKFAPSGTYSVTEFNFDGSGHTKLTNYGSDKRPIDGHTFKVGDPSNIVRNFQWQHNVDGSYKFTESDADGHEKTSLTDAEGRIVASGDSLSGEWHGAVGFFDHNGAISEVTAYQEGVNCASYNTVTNAFDGIEFEGAMSTQDIESFHQISNFLRTNEVDFLGRGDNLKYTGLVETLDYVELMGMPISSIENFNLAEQGEFTFKKSAIIDWADDMVALPAGSIGDEARARALDLKALARSGSLVNGARTVGWFLGNFLGSDLGEIGVNILNFGKSYFNSKILGEPTRLFTSSSFAKLNAGAKMLRIGGPVAALVEFAVFLPAGIKDFKNAQANGAGDAELAYRAFACIGGSIGGGISAAVDASQKGESAGMVVGSFFAGLFGMYDPNNPGGFIEGVRRNRAEYQEQLESSGALEALVIPPNEATGDPGFNGQDFVSENLQASAYNVELENAFLDYMKNHHPTSPAYAPRIPDLNGAYGGGNWVWAPAQRPMWRIKDNGQGPVTSVDSLEIYKFVDQPDPASGSLLFPESSVSNTGGEINGEWMPGPGGFGCWVAREVYGENNPRWLAFREWLVIEAPSWFRKLYFSYGPQFADFIKDKPWLKTKIKTWMETKIDKNFDMGAPKYLRLMAQYQEAQIGSAPTSSTRNALST